jgi:hypothetical protein
MINVFNIILGKPQGNGQQERPKRKWKDIIKIDLKEEA